MNNLLAFRWIHADLAGQQPKQAWRAVAIIASLSLALIAVLFVNEHAHQYFRIAWMGAMLALAFALVRARFRAGELEAARLIRLIGVLSGLYSLIHYPLMAPLPDHSAYAWYGVLLLVWLVALGCAVACYWRPSLGLVPAAYLVWSTHVAIRITGLGHGSILDVAPLSEVAVCLAFGFAIRRGYDLLVEQGRVPRRVAQLDPGEEFSKIALVLAIGIHLANYFWSAIAKLTLHGPFLSWVRMNNPINIYLTALNNDYITFANYSAARIVGEMVDRTHFLSNATVLFAQAIAVGGFLLPKRFLLLLLVVFDAMHISIAIVAGANFWPWILLNVAIGAVVVDKRYVQPRPLVGLAAAGFIMMSPLVANVALLGWYDSGANNHAYFQAEDDRGRRYYVSPNFFTFYSFPLAHMDYGMPEPETAFNVGSPNGGTRNWRIAQAGQSCNVPVLLKRGRQKPLRDKALSRFVIDNHQMMSDLQRRFGGVPYNFYPHHFFVRPSLAAPFDRLDKSRIVAYVYRRDSVCLSFRNGRPNERLVTSGEYRIEVPHEGRAQSKGQ